MHQEFLCNRLGIDPLRNEGVLAIPQGANELGGQRIIQYFDRGLRVHAVVVGHGAFLDMLAGPGPECFYIRQETCRIGRFAGAVLPARLSGCAAHG
ncbi:hypothetical protein SDC9_180755 [bioreactor metagenome]|uniref:Uncharacterized protein n=1 Tax=bioreactor metagenome TaxID=1076179 RepID=A0A645H3J6_9ZZZZ